MNVLGAPHDQLQKLRAPHSQRVAPMSIRTKPSGATFAKAALAIVREGNVLRACEALNQRGEMLAAQALTKSAVSPMTAGGLGASLMTQTAADDFIASVRPMSIIGRARTRTGPFDHNLPAVLGAASFAYWVGETMANPLTSVDFANVRNAPLQVAAVSVFTKELVRLTNAQELVEEELRRALVRAEDEAFIDPDNAGIASVKPASVTYGAETIAATGDPSVDLAAMIRAFDGDLESSFFVMHPTLAASIALHRDSGGGYTFLDIGPRGGTLLGIPVLTSRAVPYDSTGAIIALIDADAIVVSDGGTELDVAEEALVQMSNTPVNPADAATVYESLFQANKVGVRTLHYVNWKVARDGAVVVLTGATY